MRCSHIQACMHFSSILHLHGAPGLPITTQEDTVRGRGSRYATQNFLLLCGPSSVRPLCGSKALPGTLVRIVARPIQCVPCYVSLAVVRWSSGEEEPKTPAETWIAGNK